LDLELQLLGGCCHRWQGLELPDGIAWNQK
jgi:hypothetical protein